MESGSLAGVRIIVQKVAVSDRLRIAIATPAVARGDGQGRVNYEIAMRAAAVGHHVTAVTLRADEDVRGHSDIEVVSWNLDRIPSVFARSQIAILLVGRYLERHRNDFDVILVNGGFALSESDVNAAHFVHDAWFRSPVHTSRLYTGLKAAYYSQTTRLNVVQERIAFRQARSIVAVSQRVRDEILASGVSAEKVVVIPNGVDTDEFAPGKSLRRELGLPTDKMLVLFAGDMATPRKNLDGILRSVVNLRDVHVAVVGSLRANPYPEMARDLKLTDRVHFLGFRRDVANIMRSVDAFVFPSRYEACSLVMLEAMASGLPVITAVTAGGAEIVAEAGGVVLDDPEDVTRLTSEIDRLSADKGLRARLASESRETALRYSWGHMADTYLRLFEQQAAARRATPA